MLRAACLLLFSLLVVGCGTRRPAAPDGAVPAPDRTISRLDTGLRDGSPDDVGFYPGDYVCELPPLHPDAHAIGRACTAAQLCPTSSPPFECIAGSAKQGVCALHCTPDHPATPLVNEDSCPDLSKFRCMATPLSQGTIKHLCFRLCDPTLGSSTCPKQVACDPRTAGWFSDHHGEAVCVMPACTTALDCPVRTAVPCDLASGKGCPAGERCVDGPQQGGKSGGRCARPGKCDLISGLCAPHTLGDNAAKVGAPCASDLQCGGAMRCRLEQNDTAKLVRFRNGYCTIEGCAFDATLKERACPAGSGCNRLHPGGVCQRSCALGDAKSCRNNAGDQLGDYECRDWSTLMGPGKLPYAKGPLCDFGTEVRCDQPVATLPFSCSDLGGKGNPTKMACRDLKGAVLPNATDPLGFCLDETSSYVP